MSSQPSSFSSVTDPPLTFQKYTLRNLTLRDWGELCEYVAFIPYQVAKRQEVPKEDLKIIFNECIANRKLYDYQHSDIIKFVFSEQGYPKVFEMCLVRGGSVSKTEAQAIVENPENEQAILDMALAVYDLLGYDLTKKEADPSDPPTPNQ